MVLRLSMGLAAHSEPLRDPLGVASYLIRAQPRFSVDDLLLDATTSSYRLKRGGRYAQRVDSGLSAVIVNVSEDLDPRAAWEALVGLEAQAGPVRYRVMRRTADIQEAYDDGAIALVPRLCCARDAHESPYHLPAAAAIGYRWLAPWSTGTRRRHEPCLVGPLAAAARRLPVILDAGDLPPVQHASLRKALRDRPALFLNLRSPDARGPALGDRTLPLTRFRLNSTWHSALDYPGMAAPVVYRPRGEQLAAAIAAWGAQEPAGWDAPGSAQREALCAALGGALIAWLAEVER
jgi:hypothetical protein